MLLGVNATGSTGNSYFIKTDNGEILLLDAGIPIADIKRGINFEVGSVVGCIVTHKHL
jgi:glyoxylase-like metal-dependent hydrolase (beta-lactamase superfamily II)